ncbi:DUF6457 domain-containing protein [Microbacterium amylolyticum]|uniref:DUF6457 domain-containing protein n=1 Tax=Microbacterium amylolyticum TaxID=936337 RepID=A0ABS4ZES6_9MICO|nr:DUF6457 domain-containing protein [Microbacterium amylolyticum]MBP2435787.1 hypothetical protein [Microbacterium amylolyticum]
MTNPTHLPPEALDSWTRAACDELGLDRSDVDIALILDLARDVAHGVARPAAPVTAYLAGLAAGRGTMTPEDAVRRVSSRATQWSS